MEIIPPGRELDVRVTRALGWTNIHLDSYGNWVGNMDWEGDIPRYSTSDPLALELFKETEGLLFLGKVVEDGRPQFQCGWSTSEKTGASYGDTIAHAVCLAFLEVREGK